jgi:hypothetical protein
VSVPHSKGFGRRKEARSEDPVPIGRIVDDLLADDLFARAVPIATLVRRWPELVGDGLANATVPASLEAGILTVEATDGPWGTQARHFTDLIRERADDALGGGVVSRVRIVVAPAGRDLRNRRSQG